MIFDINAHIVVLNRNGLTEEVRAFATSELAEAWAEQKRLESFPSGWIDIVTVHEVEFKTDIPDSEISQLVCSDWGFIDPDNPPERE